MPVTVSATANCDDVVVSWRIDRAIPDCLGFAIEREQKQPGGRISRITLDNRMGFARDEPRPGDHRPSTEWPFQRFSWTDHSASTGDRLRYRVVPMTRANGGPLVQQLADRSAWTPWLLVSSDAGGASVSFNRGLIISQFMARYLERLRIDEGLETRKQALARFKESIGEHELPIRRFLSGVLRTDMLDLLATAHRKGHHIYGALYELDDDELIAALGKFGARGHLVLANGSITKKPGESLADARTRNQNERARAVLALKRLEIHDRMLSPGALGHNKFLVVASARRRPLAVLTGSTNWTPTGLCTQTNNALIVANRGLAAEFLAQWDRLRDAKSAFPPPLTTSNAAPKVVPLGAGRTDVWFTRTAAKKDLAALDEVVNDAREAVLFLMFQPGGSATLGTIRRLVARPDNRLYVKGVVSTLPAAEVGPESEVGVAMVGDGRTRRLDLDVVQPQGIKAPFASWAATVTRGDFIKTQGGVIGFAIVHSKVIVVDPFTRPVVVTGSHNFSISASEKNDENFMIVRGNEALALEYAVHILTVYKHYRWLAFVDDLQRQGRNPNGVLAETPAWQDRHLRGAAKREIDFWVR